MPKDQFGDYTRRTNGDGFYEIEHEPTGNTWVFDDMGRLISKYLSTEALYHDEYHLFGAENDLNTSMEYHSEVDLGGAVIPISSEVSIPSNTKLKNGTIDVNPGDYPNNAAIYAENVENVTTENLSVQVNGEDLQGIYTFNDTQTRHISPTVFNAGRWGIAFNRDNSTSEEGSGPLIESPRIKYSGTGGILVLQERDYLTIEGGEIYDCVKGIQVSGENTSVLGTTIAQCSDVGVNVVANKTKLYDTTINHNGQAITTEPGEHVQRLDIDGGQMLIHDGHAIELNDVVNSTVQSVQIGRPGNPDGATGDGVNMTECYGVTVKDVDCDIYQPDKATARYCVNEADGASSMNPIRENVGRQGAGFSLNSTDLSSGNVTVN